MDFSESNNKPLNTPDFDLTSADLNSFKPKNGKDGQPMSKRTKNKPSKNAHDSKFKAFVGRHKVLVIIVAILLVAGVIALILFLTRPHGETTVTPQAEPVKHYSKLSGLEISDESLNQNPTYCVQIPNGTDIANDRTQIGLNSAPVVFEAIAEAGITRFAAVFQNSDDSMIGPIRSLRNYYLEWDTPFNCTVVHAGGSDEALASLKSGGYRDLTESTTYMWRNTSVYRAPNNLFTSASLLAEFNDSKGYSTSEVKAPARLTPDQAAETAATNQANAEPKTDSSTSSGSTDCDSSNTDCASAVVPLVKEFAINFGSQNNFNTKYVYDPTTNTYARYFATGAAHRSLTCKTSATGENVKPNTDCGDAQQIAPSAVVAMTVQQSTAADGYHQNITTTGTGKAVIFQNGEAIEATWSKKSVNDQLEFTNTATGEAIAFTPGQLWIAAIPASTGSVKY